MLGWSDEEKGKKKGGELAAAGSPLGLPRVNGLPVPAPLSAASRAFTAMNGGAGLPPHAPLNLPARSRGTGIALGRGCPPWPRLGAHGWSTSGELCPGMRNLAFTSFG